jgi:nucleotide-binding universal stress UspA family protein
VPLPDGPSLRAIGVAYDGSPAARLALSAALRLAALGDARVEVLTAGSETDPECVRADADAVAARLSEAVDVRVRALDGRAGEALVEASEPLDLLLCGSHGRGRVLRAVLGSVSGRLVEAAHCPVLVVPPHVRRRADAPLGLTTGGHER